MPCGRLLLVGAVLAALAPAAAAAVPTVTVATDLPLQGGSAQVSSDTNRAIRLLLAASGGRAGPYAVRLVRYDDSSDLRSRRRAACT